ncbi:MAG TPA: HEAT repeat domain-containing protein [Vicinamibacteria bacterium]|nr:HEAT repeat domain-containing protein [Vicinamibacteria bacterium]
MTPFRMPSRALNGLFALAVSLVFSGSLEGVARWHEWRLPRPTVADYLWDWEKKWEGDFYTIRSDVNGWPPWEEFNQDGVRDRTHPVTPPTRVRRVMFLGDSVTLGDHIRPDQAYPQVLQARLDAAGRPAEVFNLALWGWSTRQERRAWEDLGRKYAPDEVVLAVCLNDIPELQNNLARPPRWLESLHGRSALVRAVVDAKGREIQRVEQLFTEPRAWRVLEAYDRFFTEVRGLRESVSARGARLTMIVVPFRFQVAPGAPPPVVQETIAAFCRDEGMKCLDLLPALRPVGEAAFVDYDHLSPRGAEVVAEALETGDLVDWPRGHGEVLAGAGLADVPASALGHRDPEVRTAAAWTLGRTGEPASLPRLTAALDDADAAVRREAAVALGRLADRHEAELARDGAREAARAALYRTAAGDAEEAVRWVAARTLFDLGLDLGDVPRLAALVSHDDPYVRGFAAFSLGSLGPDAAAAVPALAEALRFEDAYTRGGPATALAKMGSAAAAAVPALIQGVRDADGDNRWKAARTLGRIGPPAQPAVPLLVTALEDPNEYVRAHAARALGRIVPVAPATAAALRRAVDDPDETVRREARAALEPAAE